MPKVDLKQRAFYGRNGRITGWFKPSGKRTYRGRGARKTFTANRVAFESEPLDAARLFVGFNVGQKPTYRMNDLMAIVQAVREDQVGAADASFVSQRGFYTHEEGPHKGELVREDGGQVAVINTAGSSRADFQRQMTDLATVIAQEMQQELVILELQRDGTTDKVLGVAP